MALDIAQLLAFAVKNNASDLHLSAGVPPMIRVDGDMKRVNMPALTNKEVPSMVYDIRNGKERWRFGHSLLKGAPKSRLTMAMQASSIIVLAFNASAPISA